MTIISSAQNAVFKYIKSLQDKKYRNKYKEYTVEGIKSVHDALNSDKEVKRVILSDTFNSDTDFGVETNIFSEALFKRLCDTNSPQGIMAVIAMDDTKDFVIDPAKSYIYCDGINDPGNLGTIIRTADAAGFDGVLLSAGTVDLYNPKVVRASMGSFFNIEIVNNLDISFLEYCSNNGFTLYGGALGQNTIDYRSADMTVPSIIVVGNEANGISKQVQELCRCVKIPIVGKAESLNAAVAAAILMYEYSSQRGKF